MKNLFFTSFILFCCTPILAISSNEKANPSNEEKSILATTKINSTVYVFYDDFIKIYDEKIENEGIRKEHTDLFASEKEQNQEVNAAVYFGKDLLYLIEGNFATAFHIPKEEVGLFRKNDALSGSLQQIFRLPNDWYYLDAAIRLNESKILFIKGNHMICYDTDLMKPGKPVQISKSMLTKAIGSSKVEAGYLDKSLKTVLILKDN